jgi:predicted Zn-dependent peptidase
MDNHVRFGRTVLDNGIVILTEQIPTVESFALGISLDAGSANDPEGLEGMAHLLEHAIFKSSKKYTARKIATEFESVGAYTNAYTSKEFTCFYVRALTKNFKKSINTLSEIILNPLFKDKEIKNEISVVSEEIVSYEDDPEEAIFDFGDELLFKGTRLEHPIVGYVETVKKITPEKLRDFHSKFFAPNRLVISFAGNLDHDYVAEKVAAIFGNLPALRLPEMKVETINSKKELLKEMPISQLHFLMGKQVPGLRADDRHALSCFNVLFGDGMSSRLYHALRERNGLGYAVYSNLQGYKDLSAFYIYAALDENKLKRAEKIIIHELEKLHSGSITKAELQRAKEQLKSGTIMELESLSVRMQSLAKSEILSQKHETLQNLMEDIDSISMEDIRDVIDKYFSKDDWSKIIITPNGD